MIKLEESKHKLALDERARSDARRAVTMLLDNMQRLDAEEQHLEALCVDLRSPGHPLPKAPRPRQSRAARRWFDEPQCLFSERASSEPATSEQIEQALGALLRRLEEHLRLGLRDVEPLDELARGGILAEDGAGGDAVAEGVAAGGVRGFRGLPV